VSIVTANLVEFKFGHMAFIKTVYDVHILQHFVPKKAFENITVNTVK